MSLRNAEERNWNSALDEIAQSDIVSTPVLIFTFPGPPPPSPDAPEPRLDGGQDTDQSQYEQAHISS